MSTLNGLSVSLILTVAHMALSNNERHLFGSTYRQDQTILGSVVEFAIYGNPKPLNPVDKGLGLSLTRR